jgi:phenol 2-monooxygenase
MVEIRFWNPNEQGALYRSGMIVDTSPGLSRFQQATLHQGVIEDHLMGYIREHSDIQVEYGVMPENLNIDADQVDNPDAYPVSCTVRYLVKEKEQPNGNGGSHIPNGLYRSNLAADTTDQLLQAAKEDASSSTEEILAKYVVGCDGAHSWTRRQIGSVMEGEQTDFIWGVLDIIPITDFPDIRYRCAIHSASGSMMVIPRENKYVRLYIQITETDESGQVLDRHKISPETLTQAAQRILSPYKFSYKHCHWWTAYRIGQRVGSKFSANRRVFLAGDAVHTHSPKAGQGMNISMHDSE